MRLGKITKLAGFALFTFGIFSLQALSSDTPLPASAMADKVVVLKRERKLLLINGNEVLKNVHCLPWR
jgi:hypothetical protein